MLVRLCQRGLMLSSPRELLFRWRNEGLLVGLRVVRVELGISCCCIPLVLSRVKELELSELDSNSSILLRCSISFMGFYQRRRIKTLFLIERDRLERFVV